MKYKNVYVFSLFRNLRFNNWLPGNWKRPQPCCMQDRKYSGRRLSMPIDSEVQRISGFDVYVSAVSDARSLTGVHRLNVLLSNAAKSRRSESVRSERRRVSTCGNMRSAAGFKAASATSPTVRRSLSLLIHLPPNAPRFRVIFGCAGNAVHARRAPCCRSCQVLPS